jgi:hypothetical protein
MSGPLHSTCSIHGVFSAAPNNILNGSGCAACGVEKHLAFSESRKLTTEEWISRAVQVHGNKYDYSRTVYAGAQTKTPVYCPKAKHGLFLTTNGHFSEGNGCPKCAVSLSKGEDEVFRLVRLFTPAIQRDRIVLKPRELDIYLPEAKLAIEYSGMAMQKQRRNVSTNIT